MRGNGKDGDYAFLRAIIPETPVSSGRFLFCVGGKDLFFVWAYQAHILMGLQATVPGIAGQEFDGFLDGLIAFLF